MCSTEEASVSASVTQEQNQPGYTDRERMEYLFMTGAQLDVDEEVAKSTIDILERIKVTKSWQLKKLPDAVLERLLPMGRYLQAYLLAVNVRDILQQWDKQVQVENQGLQASSAVAEAPNLWTQKVKR